MSASSKIFTIKNFSPVGFKDKYYPMKYCPVCRGLLRDVCSECIDKKYLKCDVIVIDDIYYHQHCSEIADIKSEKKEQQDDIDDDYSDDYSDDGSYDDNNDIVLFPVEISNNDADDYYSENPFNPVCPSYDDELSEDDISDSTNIHQTESDSKTTDAVNNVSPLSSRNRKNLVNMNILKNKLIPNLDLSEDEDYDEIDKRDIIY